MPTPMHRSCRQQLPNQLPNRSSPSTIGDDCVDHTSLEYLGNVKLRHIEGIFDALKLHLVLHLDAECSNVALATISCFAITSRDAVSLPVYPQSLI